MLRRLTVAILAAGLILVTGTAAAAAPSTQTRHEKGLVETFIDIVPTCGGGGPRYTVTTTTNTVEHETIFADGRVHATFTQTGRFVAEPLNSDAGLPNYTGRLTIWGGFNDNGKTVNGTFTFNIRGTGSDGSTFRTHLVDHFNERPDGSVNAFFRCH